MSVSEDERHQLRTRFEEHMGSERASAIMRSLPRVGWGDVATRRDLEEFRVGTRHDLEEIRVGTRHDLEEIRRDLRHLEDRLDARLDAKIGALRSELLRTLGTWLFASQAAVIAAVSVLVALD
jgi:hypothetical protein